jgi:hypothetical protein
MSNPRFGWAVALVGVFCALNVAADAGPSSPSEQLVQGDAIVSKMGVTASTVRRALEQSRTQRDVVKTLCLNDKLNQIDVAFRSAQDRRHTLEQAITRHDNDLSRHEFTILLVLKQRVDQLDFEARQCLGTELQFLGEAKVTTMIDPNIPGQHVVANPDQTPVISAPPPCDSCYF